MKLSNPTSYFERNIGLKGTVDLLSEAGFDAIDFSAYFPEYMDDTYDKAFYTEIKKYAQSKGVYFNQAHGPDTSSFVDEEKTKQRFIETVNTLKHASYLGVETIVVHPCQHLLYCEDGNPEKLFEINMDFYGRLIPYCEEYGIKVAVENMWQYPGMISHSTCSKPDEFIRYVDELNNDSIVACLDLGHTMLCNEQPHEFIKKLGKRLTNLHVHDVEANNDAHTLPFFGIIDWEKVMKALAEIDYKGDLTYEANAFVKQPDRNWGAKPKPKELYLAYAQLMEKTGRYLIGRFEEYKKNI